MRALKIAAGLCLAVTAASAGTQDDVVTRSGGNIALANGCVYAPTIQGNAWTLIYRQSGATKHCALTVKTKGQRPAGLQAQAISRSATRATLKSGFIVGAFR